MNRLRQRRFWMPLVAAALAVLLVGLGVLVNPFEASDEDQVRETTEQFFVDLSNGDGEAACNVLTEAGEANVKLLAGLSALGTSQELEEDCAEAATDLDASLFQGVDAEDVDVDEDGALVETDEGFDVELVKEDEDWKIDSPGLSEAALGP